MSEGNRVAHKKAAKEYVAKVRGLTFCAKCGAQPIEWHNPEHDKNKNHQVPHLASRGYSIERIQEEIAASTPLCRACHQIVDGRNVKPVGPCPQCGKTSKLSWRGLCHKCYRHNRYRGLYDTRTIENKEEDVDEEELDGHGEPLKDMGALIDGAEYLIADR
jgi:predicted RNA-binding Zn-ribbon protein involved in translation (DUF1610 family)